MGNIVKFNSGVKSANSIKSGTFDIGVNSTPTNLTGFYTGISPINGGYTIYIDKASGGPSIYAPKDDATLINIVKTLGASVSTAADALVWINSQSNMTVLNNNYPSIVTDGLILNLDAGFVSSYPKTGTTWRDLSGNGNNGTLINGVGFSGGSMVFDGVNDRVQLANPITLSQTSDWTLQVWVKSNQTLSGNSYLRLINLNIGGGSNYLFFEWNNRIIGNNSLGTGFVFQTGWTPGLPLDNSTFLLTLVGRGGFLEVYSNLTKTTVNAQLSGDLTFNSLMNANNVFSPGGSINSFMCYNRALSQQEIQQNYYAGLQRFIPTDGLVLSLDAQNTNLYATSPTTAYDISGNGNNVALTNGVQYVADGGGSWSFDGVDDYIKTPTISNFRTFNFWVKIKYKTDWRYLVDARPGMTSGGYYTPNGSSGWTSQYINGSLTSVDFNLLQLNEWCNLTLIAGANYTSTINFMSRYTNNEINGGGLNEIRIYNRVLAQSEITTIYNATKSRYGIQ